MKKKIGRNGAQLQYVAGVDEAGRGPLAGPVAVGVVLVPRDFDWDLITGVGDSKKVTPKNREAIFRRTQTLKKQGALNYAVVLVGASVIDGKGISHAVRAGIERAFAKLCPNPASTAVKLDGLLKAPETFKFQETIIKGDAKEKVIGLASIMAKVTRDRYMVRLARKHPQYGFEIHKGYGTRMHRAAIMAHGPCVAHRVSFIKNCV